jgi:probable F420-dependent oxidoreductase
MGANLALTVPVPGIGLAEHEALVRGLVRSGYHEIWSGESNSFDAFTPLALAAAWDQDLRLGTAVVPAFTRGPAVIAQSAAAMASAAPGRFQLGIGASSPAVVRQWNGIEFDHPYQRTRDLLRFLRSALAGERISRDYGTFSVRGFRLEMAPAEQVPVLLGALRPQMLALAGREADGAILNWLSADDILACVAEINNPAARVVARILVVPTDDADLARSIGKRMIAGHLTVPGYAAFQRWLGREAAFADMWRLWENGDRIGAVHAIDDETVDELIVHGDWPTIRRAIDAYVAAGVDVPVVALLPTPEMADPAHIAAVLNRLAARSPDVRVTGPSARNGSHR